MKFFDVSLHFTIKDQSLSEIKEKLIKFLSEQDEVDFGNLFKGEPDTILHHCFLPREIVEAKGFSTELVDTLDQIAGKDQVRWFGASTNLDEARNAMLRNLLRLGGAAIFVGEIKEGVAQEWELVKEYGIHCYHIA